MKKEIIQTDQAPTPKGQYSQAVKLGDMVYVAGTCPFDVETGEVLHAGDVGAQTTLVLQYIDEILKAAGSSKENVVKVTAFLTDQSRSKEYNEAYKAYFQEEPPSRSTIEVGKFPEGMTVEIECIAFVS